VDPVIIKGCGVVSSRTRLKRGLVYSVILENGKTVDECSVNKILSDCHIVRGLTKTLKNEKRNNTTSLNN
jgi:hypothetical protein